MVTIKHADFKYRGFLLYNCQLQGLWTLLAGGGLWCNGSSICWPPGDQLNLLNFEEHLKDLNAVIFDVDGLMLDTEAVGLITWTRACADFGFQMTKEIFLEMVGRNTADSNDACFRAFGPEFPVAEVRARKIGYGREYISKHGLAPKPGLLELLATLSQQKVKIGVATSTDRKLALERLAAAGLPPEKFNAITCGDEVSCGKPAPDIFLETARRLGVDPSRCLVLEDSEAGIAGAAAAGMSPVMVPDLKPASEQARAAAFKILPSLVEARTLILSILKEIPA